MEINEITGQVVRCALRVHSILGPGLLESAYRTCLHHELTVAGLKTLVEHPLPICYDGLVIDVAYRLDLVVEDHVIVELKSVPRLLPVHQAQVLSYLRLSNLQVGLLINFNVSQLRLGIRRLVNRGPNLGT